MKFYIGFSCSSGCETQSSGLYVFSDTVCEAIEKAKQIFYTANMNCDLISITINQQSEGIIQKDKKERAKNE